MPLIDKQIIRKVENQLRGYPQHFAKCNDQRNDILHGTKHMDSERTCQTWHIGRPTEQRGIDLAELSEGWGGAITTALKRMPREHRQLIELRYFEELDPDIVADRLYISRRLFFAWRERILMTIILLATQRGLLKPFDEAS